MPRRPAGRCRRGDRDVSTDLLTHFLDFMDELRPLFKRSASARRAKGLMLAALLCVGRKWMTRILCAQGREQQEWSANYKLFSRSPWKAADLFAPAIEECLRMLGPEGPIPIAGDELRTRRGGRKVARSRWTADPMSPPFHVNFFKGIRWLHFCVLLPLHRATGRARGVPVLFEPVDLPPRPGRRASPEARAAYEREKRNNPMTRKAAAMLRGLRAAFDRAGAAARTLVVALDGGFCNRHLLREGIEGVCLVLRCRRDAKLCGPANDPACPRRVYGKRKFSPESVRTDKRRKWREAYFWYGGARRVIRYKEVRDVLWQPVARTRRLRLIVVAPTAYQLSPGMPRYYRQPSYILVDDMDMSLENILQAYFDRWEIEVDHRDFKQHIGVSDAQVWNPDSVDRLPAFMVAATSYLLLASIKAYGPGRGPQYQKRPKWQRRDRKRPSCLDLLARLRQEAAAADPQIIGFEVDLERILMRVA